MKDGFIISLGQRRISLFSLPKIPFDLEEYNIDGVDFSVILTPSDKYDIRASAYNKHLGEYIAEPDALLAIAVFFMKVRGLPVSELEIEYNGTPVRIKASLSGYNSCALELEECKLICTNNYISASGTELKVATLSFCESAFVRTMRCEHIESVSTPALRELNFIPGIRDTVASGAYCVRDTELEISCDKGAPVSLLLCGALLDYSRTHRAGRRLSVKNDCGIEYAEVLSSGLIRLCYLFSVEKTNVRKQ